MKTPVTITQSERVFPDAKHLAVTKYLVRGLSPRAIEVTFCLSTSLDPMDSDIRRVLVRYAAMLAVKKGWRRIVLVRWAGIDGHCHFFNHIQFKKRVDHQALKSSDWWKAHSFHMGDAWHNLKSCADWGSIYPECLQPDGRLSRRIIECVARTAIKMNSIPQLGNLVKMRPMYRQSENIAVIEVGPAGEEDIRQGYSWPAKIHLEKTDERHPET